MGIYDRDYYRGESSRGGIGANHSAVVILIALNVFFFVASLFTATSETRGNLEQVTRNRDRGPGSIGEKSNDLPPLETKGDWLKRNMEVSGHTLTHPQRWWQFISYGFAHANALHLFLNMFTLWMFGREVEAFYGKREFVSFFLVAMILGGIWWSFRQSFLMGTPNNRALGASGACSAVLLLFILRDPHRTVLFLVPMPAWVLGIVLVMLDLFGRDSSRIAVDIHLTGFAFAAAYFWSGIRITRWTPSGNWFQRARQAIKRTPSLRVHSPPEDAHDLDLEREGDRILAKLNSNGDASLTAKERKTLEAYSRQTRERLRRKGTRD